MFFVSEFAAVSDLSLYYYQLDHGRFESSNSLTKLPILHQPNPDVATTIVTDFLENSKFAVR